MWGMAPWGAPFLAFCARGGCWRRSRCRRSNAHLHNFSVVHPHFPLLPIQLIPKAAPWPLFRFIHQTSRHWIAMHVAQLFDALMFGSNVEVVKSRLPNVSRTSGRERTLTARQQPQDPLRVNLLHDLHRFGRIAFLRFAHQKMKVLGHDDIAVHHVSVSLAGLFEDV